MGWGRLAFLYLRMAVSESSEKYSEVPLYELRERYGKSEEGRKFLQEAILDSHSDARLAGPCMKA